jgi:hypothetical protein
VDVELKFRVGVQVATPGGDLGVQVGNTIDDRHWISLFGGSPALQSSLANGGALL